MELIENEVVDLIAEKRHTKVGKLHAQFLRGLISEDEFWEKSKEISAIANSKIVKFIELNREIKNFLNS